MPVSITPAIAEFLRKPIVATIATINPDGSPQLTYVWYEFDGERFSISTTDDRLKSRNVMRDARLGLSMLDPANPFRYVSIRGSVSISKVGADDLILRLATHYMGPNGEGYGRSMQGPNRNILIVTPDHLYANNF